MLKFVFEIIGSAVFVLFLICTIHKVLPEVFVRLGMFPYLVFGLYVFYRLNKEKFT